MIDSTSRPKKEGNYGARRRSPAKLGRQTKLTPEVEKKVVDAIRAGAYLEVAARYAGIGTATLKKWLALGRDELARGELAQQCRHFVAAVDEAEAQSEVAAVLHWRSAMPKDWNAARQYLVARHPERWSPDRGERNGAMAAVQVNIGATGGQSGGRGAPIEPLSAVLERNPALIAPTMELMDRLMPLDDAEEGENGADKAKADPFGADVVTNRTPTGTNPPEDVEFGTIRRLNAGEAADVEPIEGEWRPFDSNEGG